MCICILGIMVVVVVMVFVLVGCGGGGGGDEVVDVDFVLELSGMFKVWGFENVDDVGILCMDYVVVQLKDVEVDFDVIVFDVQKFIMCIVSGDVFDVVQMDCCYVIIYVVQDLIMLFDECFVVQDVLLCDYWYLFVVDDVVYEDVMWVVLQFYQLLVILLNKVVLDEVGVMVEEIDILKFDVLFGVVEKMYQEFGGVLLWLGFDFVVMGQVGLWIFGMGGQFNDDKGVLILDDLSNVVGIEMFKQIMDVQGGFVVVKSFIDLFDFFGDQNQFVVEQVGVQVNVQWYLNVLGLYVDQIQFEVVLFCNVDGELFFVVFGMVFVILVGVKNLVVVCVWMVEFIFDDVWMVVGEVWVKMLEIDGGINIGLFMGFFVLDQVICEKFVMDSGNVGFDQVIFMYYDVVDYGQLFGFFFVGQEIQNEFNNVVIVVFFGDKLLEEVLVDVQDVVMWVFENVMVGQILEGQSVISVDC